MTYDQHFFDGIREGIKRSAESLVPLLVSELSPAIDVKSVIDVGCGEGWWGREFAFWDFVPVGMDKWTDTEVVSMIDHDLQQPLEQAFPEGTINRFGLALCLEVAEHLTPERGPSFIADLCKLSDLIVFSAAIPGQRGVNHLNEQWIDYWANLFLDNEFDVSGAMRWMIWNDPDIEPWYCVPDTAEILTFEGWRTLGELNGSERVLTYSVASQTLEWESMLGLTVLDYDGPMVEVSGRWLCTPDHRWPVLNQVDFARRQGPRWRTAKTLLQSDRVLQCAEEYMAPTDSILSPHDAAILGWLVTDGYFRIRANGSPAGVIYQSPNAHLGKILDLVGDEAGKPRADNRPTSHGCVTVPLRTSVLWRLVRAGYRCKEDLSWMVPQLSMGAIDAMWEAMMLGDGTVNRTTTKGKEYESLMFDQLPGPVFDAFQLLSLLRGNRVNQSGVAHSVGGTGNGGKSSRTVAARPKSGGNYAGKVWCPTTPNGTWVMRQNGAIAITGNCQNLLIATKHPERLPNLFATPLSYPWPVVHPRKWAEHEGVPKP